MAWNRILALIAALLATSAPAANVNIPAGANIQSYINANPAGTQFTLTGTNFLSSPLVPKSGNIFTGTGTLTGSKLLTNFTQSSGRWYVGGQTQQGSTNGGECLSGYGRCANPEDVFVDGKALKHETSLSKLGPGEFFFDYSADRIYLGDNPVGHKVETSVTAKAFAGKAGINGVVLRGLTVEKFASRSSDGAIDSGDGSGWLLDGVTAQWNHAVGVTCNNCTIQNGKLLNNGQTGAQDTASGRDGGYANILNNEIAGNNRAGYNYDWEAGGIKFCVMDALNVKNNYAHDNFGNAIWDDISSKNVLYEGNRVENNYKTGIVHEIGKGSAVIRNNLVKNNRSTSDNGGQIVVYSSPNTEVYGNTVVTDSNSHGIIGVAEDRTDDGGHRLTGLNVHHNDITMGAAGNDSLSGIAGFDAFNTTRDNLKFDFNTYRLPSLSGTHWEWGPNKTWAQIQALGQERNGKVITASSSLVAGRYSVAASYATSPTPEPSTLIDLSIASIVFALKRTPRKTWPIKPSI